MRTERALEQKKEAINTFVESLPVSGKLGLHRVLLEAEKAGLFKGGSEMATAALLLRALQDEHNAARRPSDLAEAEKAIRDAEANLARAKLAFARIRA